MKRECRKWLESVQDAATRTIEAGKDRTKYQGPPIQPTRKMPSYADRPTVYQPKAWSPSRATKPRPAPEAAPAHQRDAAHESEVRELMEQQTKIKKRLATLTQVSRVEDDSAQENDGQESLDDSKNC
jgi:hypothetical protein